MSDSLKNFLNKNAEKVPSAPREELLNLREKIGFEKNSSSRPWWQIFLPVAGIAAGLAIVFVTQGNLSQTQTSQVAAIQNVDEGEEAYVFESYDQFEELLNESLSVEVADGDVVFL